jgi:hypothetical protein
MSPPSEKITDAWTQPALPQGFVHLPEVTPLFKQSGTADLLRTGVTSEEMVLQMDAAGIGVALLSAWHRPGKWIFTNDQVAEIETRSLRRRCLRVAPSPLAPKRAAGTRCRWQRRHLTVSKPASHGASACFRATSKRNRFFLPSCLPVPSKTAWSSSVNLDEVMAGD